MLESLFNSGAWRLWCDVVVPAIGWAAIAFLLAMACLQAVCAIVRWQRAKAAHQERKALLELTYGLEGTILNAGLTTDTTRWVFRQFANYAKGNPPLDASGRTLEAQYLAAQTAAAAKQEGAC